MFRVTKLEGGIRKALPERELYVTECGNVMGDYPDAQAIPDGNARPARELRARRDPGMAKEWLWEWVNHAGIPYPARPRVEMMPLRRLT